MWQLLLIFRISLFLNNTAVCLRRICPQLKWTCFSESVCSGSCSSDSQMFGCVWMHYSFRWGFFCRRRFLSWQRTSKTTSLSQSQPRVLEWKRIRKLSCGCLNQSGGLIFHHFGPRRATPDSNRCVQFGKLICTAALRPLYWHGSNWFEALYILNTSLWIKLLYDK